ncbi:MAG: fatty acid cis/trans isomerase [Pseudomonadota bacterium]
MASITRGTFRYLVNGLCLALLAAPAALADKTFLATDYPSEVKPIVEQRCVVCHGCYDAPCQLKMDAVAGLMRGASKDKVYDGSRLRNANLTRLFEDAHTIAQWRGKGFYPVLNEPDARDGTLYKMLALKEEYPLPTKGTLPDNFNFRLDRDQSCPKPEEFARYRVERPYQGMPYGFPGLDEDRLRTLKAWINAGAPAEPLALQPMEEQEAVDRWEAFLNAGDNRSRLMSRYIFEHLFIASLYFDDLPGRSAGYALVRSRTPSGEPVEVIATRRPYDDPGSEPFYYRLQQRPVTTLAKRHMPYALNAERMARWESLFLEPDYTVETLPDYKGAEAANPFITFEALPVEARYQFMLDEAQFTIMAYIKGPVCRGQVALNVIDDHFWVAFVRPNRVDPEQHADFLAEHAKEMRLPQAKGSLVVSLLQWRGYAKSQQRFVKAQAEKISEVLESDALKLNLNLIWDGGPEKNPNAALTVFRHFDSASVVRGLVGQHPKTMWVIDYSLLERIHYLLVAGFDVYGAVGHQLESRLYMDFLRMEGEQTFLLFLPEEERLALRNYWYRDAKDHVKEYVFSKESAQYERPTSITYETENPRTELMDLLRERTPAARDERYTVEDAELSSLMSGPSAGFRYLPEVAFLQVLPKQGAARYYTLLHNRAFKNNAHLFKEEDRRVPNEDTMTVARGFVGAYPNMFFQISESQLEKFVSAVGSMSASEDYTKLVNRYGVRRTAPWFWKLSDDMHQYYRNQYPQEAGLFDLNRYQNR